MTGPRCYEKTQVTAPIVYSSPTGFTDLRRVTVDVPGANGILMAAKPWQA